MIILLLSAVRLVSRDGLYQLPVTSVISRNTASCVRPFMWVSTAADLGPTNIVVRRLTCFDCGVGKLLFKRIHVTSPSKFLFFFSARVLHNYRYSPRCCLWTRADTSGDLSNTPIHATKSNIFLKNTVKSHVKSKLKIIIKRSDSRSI